MLISGQFETNLIFGTPPPPYCLTETKYEHFLLRTDPLWREFLKNGLKSNFLEKLLRDFPVKNEEKFLLEIFT